MQIQAPGMSKASEVAILISAALRPELLSQEQDPAGRYIFLNVKLDNAILMLASIYAPNDKQLDFLDNVLQKLSSFSKGPVILGGDLNALADFALDYSGRRKISQLKGTSRVGGGCLQSLLLKHHLLNVWRHLYPQAREYTYYSSQYNSFSRIDFFPVSSSLERALLDADVRLRL